MQKFLIIICLLASISFAGAAQNFNTNTKIKNFIKVWGFLKYYHPAIATGNIDWDSIFIRNIESISDAETTSDFNNKISGIINSAGNITGLVKHKFYDSLCFMNKTDVKWITTSTIFNKEVKKKLLIINSNKNQDSNKYIKITYNTADFSGEKKYDSMEFPDTAYRLLFLARFWNIINYFAPYKYLTTNWDDVLQHFIPQIIASTDTLTYYKTLLELCKSLNDGHSSLSLRDQSIIPLDLIFGNYIAPFYCDIIENKVVVRKVKNDSFNIRQGDIILKVDDKRINQLINERVKYFPASNKVSELYALSWYLFDSKTPSMKLTIQRDNKVFNLNVTRTSNAARNWFDIVNYTSNDVGYQKFKDSVLLIYAGQITDNNLDTLNYLIKQSKAVIFDVRNYPGNDAFFYIVDPFLCRPEVINLSTVALPDNPGLFQWQVNPEIGRNNDSAFKGKVLILADERSQSQGEYSCMVLQTIPGAITIGSQTAGCDGVYTSIPLGGGISLSYSGYGVYYPDKRQTQRVGIKIDIYVKKTLEGISKNKDEILEIALQYLQNKN